ncbi:hypothetical protein ACNOYE_25165 [Nannocystaceae bacterium ST9]
MNPPARSDAQRLRAGRLSLAIALVLVAIGVLRFVTDTLHEMNPNYWQAFEGTPLRYVIRAPSDGSLAGRLNAQWFKLLSVPAGLALIWLWARFDSGTWEDKRAAWADATMRLVWIGSFVAGFTLIELEKQFHMLGMNTLLVEGELSWLNHVVHLASAGLAWWLADRLEFEPLRQAEIDLERELDALEVVMPVGDP